MIPEGFQPLRLRLPPPRTVNCEYLPQEIYRASVPSGASTGKYEAVELRDGDPKSFFGKGVEKAIDSVNSVIAPALLSSKLSITNQREVDDFICKLDGTKNKAKLGANAILSVSLATARAAADLLGIPLCKYINGMLPAPRPLRMPIPFLNVINGGVHAGNLLGFQEFMISPNDAGSFTEAMKIGSEVYQGLKSIIKEKFGIGALNVGDEGGFAPPLCNPEDALDLIMLAIERAGYPGRVSIALDVAASDVNQGNGCKSKLELSKLYQKLLEEYPSKQHFVMIVISLEDPFDQDDLSSWSNFMKMVPKEIQVVADDLTVTNSNRIKIAHENKACNCLLLKVNQIGTLTEAIDRYFVSSAKNDSAKLAYSFGWNVMVSHRSGETEDSFIADLAVGLGAGKIKSGAPCRGERTSKYNQLLRLEKTLFNQLPY